MDIVGPVLVTDSGNYYMLVAMDYFTKRFELHAVPDQSANRTAEILVDEMFVHFKAPADLPSDQGQNFKA